MGWRSVLVAVAISVLAASSGAEDMTTIGAVEDAILLPWGMKVPARIDTGASTSSLDVCEFSIDGKYVVFTLADRCGGYKVRKPLLEWKDIRTSEGTERRPVVEMIICLGSKRIKAKVTLNDRSRMEYPLLIGRKTLRGKFIVDVSKKNVLPPACPAAKSGYRLDDKPDFAPDLKKP